MTGWGSTAWLRLPLPGLLALSLSLGCMTPQPEEDPELRLRRARSHFNLAVDHMQNDRVELGLRELYKAESYDAKDARIQHGIGIGAKERPRQRVSSRTSGAVFAATTP